MKSGSIIVPFYGDPEPTMRLIEALLPQLGEQHELIVSDDASPMPFPSLNEVTVVRRVTNGGFGANCNTGAAQASRELLLFLNSDLEIGPTFVEDFLRQAAGWQPCVAGPRILDFDGSLTVSPRHFPTWLHQAVEWLTPLARWRGLRALHEAVGHDMLAAHSEATTTTAWLMGAVLLVPRADFEAVGGFDEGFFMNAEEIDLQRRLRARGLPSVYLPQLIVRHEGGGSSDPQRSRRWLVEARYFYARKWGAEAPLTLALRIATGINAMWNVGRRALGRDTEPWRTARYELSLIRDGRRQP